MISTGLASSRDIDRLRAAEDRLTPDRIVAALDTTAAHEVDCPPQDGLQFLLHLRVIKQTPLGIR